jgi:hypothetical protein
MENFNIWLKLQLFKTLGGKVNFSLRIFTVFLGFVCFNVRFFFFFFFCILQYLLRCKIVVNEKYFSFDRKFSLIFGKWFKNRKLSFNVKHLILKLTDPIKIRVESC